MKKRILALLLTVCMLVLSVPMFVLPAAAEEEPVYSTSFPSDDTMPKPEAFTPNGTSVEWPGAWSFVSYNRWQTPGKDNPQGQNGMYWTGPLNNESAWGGFMSHSGKYTAINYGNTDKANRGSIGSILAASRTCDENIKNDAGKVVGSGGGTAGIRYTAEKTGVLNIYFDKLGNDAENVEGKFYYYLYVGGEKVKEWTLEKAAGAEQWIYSEKTLVAEDVNVRAGQVIEFLCDTELLPADNALGRGGNCLFPTIEYTSTADRFSTSYSDKSNTPTHEGDKPVYSGNWTALSTRKDNGTYDYKNLINIDWAGTSGNYANLATSGGNAFLSWGQTNVNYHAKVGTVGANASQAAVIRYTSEKAGVADIYFDLLGNVSNNGGQNGGEGWGLNPNGTTFTYTVYLNGIKIWPADDSTVNSVNCKQNGSKIIYSQQTLAVSGVTLNVGDKIDFVCESDYLADVGTDFLWGSGGNAMFSTIEFTKVNDNVVAFNELTNVPVINEDTTVTFNGGFYGVGYENVGTDDSGKPIFDYSDPEAALVMDTQTALWGAGNGIAPKAPHLAWANKAHMVLKAFNGNYFNQVGQICSTGTMSGALRYVAQETGTVNIDFGTIGNTAPLSAGISKMTFYVYVNGDEIWSSADTLVWEEGKKNQIKNNVAVATGVDLKFGDVIDFIVEADVAAGGLWDGAGNVIQPNISWTKIVPKATTSVNLALGTNFALNAKVEVPLGVLTNIKTDDAGKLAVGLLVNDEDVDLTQTGDTTFAAYNVLKAYAQDLAKDTVTLQPYYVTVDGETILGVPSTANILDVLQAYAGAEDKATKDLATATLNYVAEAQSYFDPSLSADQLANAILGDKDMSYRDMAVSESGSAIVIKNKRAKASFAGVSMVLNNAVALKLHIALPEGADIKDYKLEVVELATQDAINNNKFDKGTATAKIQLKNIDVEGNAVAYVGTTFENMDKVYQFRVLDAKGKVVSDTVAYSPLAYATRMANDIEVGYVCKALIALDAAIDAYAAAR